MRYKFLLDPIFLISILLYSINKSLLIFTSYLNKISLLTGYFNDLLLIPCVLPLLIFIINKLGFRSYKYSPQTSEVIITISIVVIICEFIGPFILIKGTYDLVDILAYSLGGLISLILWKYTTISYFNFQWRKTLVESES